MNDLNKLNLHKKPLTIGALPSSYLASLTYEEQLLWLSKKTDEIIAFINDILEQKISELNQALQLQQTGVSTCFLEDYEDNFFEVKYKQVSCCKIAPITNENYCPNCGKKILK